MKLKYVLPTILSLSTLSTIPISLCPCTNDFVQNHENILDNPTSTIKFNTTVGHGHTIYDEEGQEIEFGKDITIDPSEDFRCTFASKEYGKDEEPKMPVHRQLKTKDVEVVQNQKTNVIAKCSLINNVLTIPSTLLQSSSSIEINLLGAEIADWISWDNIQEISKDDDEHTADEYSVTNWFEVGDYKMIYEEKKAQPYGYATIIDMEKKDYIYKEGNREKTAPSPFTFEILEPHDEQTWTGEKEDKKVPYPDSWETTQTEKWACGVWEQGWKYGEDKRFGFTPRVVDCNSADSRNNHSYFYALSLEEQLGITTDELDWSGNSVDGDHSIDESKSKNAFYAYYNSEQYHSVKTICQRVNRSKTRWTRSTFRNTFTSIDERKVVNYFLRMSQPKRYYWAYNQYYNKFPVSWAFCL